MMYIKQVSLIAMTVASLMTLGCSRGVHSADATEGQDEKAATVKPTVVTDATFEEEVINAEGLVLVDFWATWCGPCRKIAPALKELAVDYEGRVKICKLDVDKNPDTAQKYKVQGIPYLVMFNDGKAIDAKVGADRKANYAAWFDKLL